jgi:hypothetical protein
MNENTSVRWRAFIDPQQLGGSLVLGLVVGMAGGLVAGVAARVAMRLVAVLAGQQPGFSIGGTLFIIGLGAILGALPGIIFSFLQPFVPGPIRLKAVLFGLLLSVMIILPILLIEPQGELALLPKGVIAALFAPIPLIYGLVLGEVATRLIPRNERKVVDTTGFVRSAGLLTIIAAVAGGGMEFILAITHPAILNLGFRPANILEGIAGGAVIFITLIGIAGLMRSNAVGNGRLGKIGFSVTLLSFPLLGMVAVSEGLNSMNLHGLVRLMERSNDPNGTGLLLYPLLFGLSGLLLAGIAVLRARRWRGWRRYIPLLIGLYPVLSIMLLYPALLPSVANISYSGRNELGHWLGALFFLAWLALGIALRRERGQAQITMDYEGVGLRQAD